MLALLSQGDRYGYDVSELLSRKIDISDGSVYPILRKLKAEGLVTAYLSEDSGGPPRKYYRLTGWAKRNTGARARMAHICTDGRRIAEGGTEMTRETYISELTRLFEKAEHARH